jgi:molybdate-binding protein
MVQPDLALPGVEIQQLLRQPLRWAMRQEGAGAQRFLLEALSRYRVRSEDLEKTTTALSERDAACAITLGLADIAPGARSAATESGLTFVATGWECFDLALERGIYFRKLFQDLIARLKSPDTGRLGELLGGYDLREAGRLVWGQD